MKKGQLISLFLWVLLIIIPSIFAVQIDLSRESYQPIETLQAEITGNFLLFEPEHILIYEQGKVHSTPMISDLMRKDDIYYFYAVLPNKEGNYTIKIEDAEYTENRITKTDTITKDFMIKESNRSALSIMPGFVLTNSDFDIGVESLIDNLNLTITLEATGETKEVFLIKEIGKMVGFSIVGITEPTFITIQEIGEAKSVGFFGNLFGSNDEDEEEDEIDYKIPVVVIQTITEPPVEPVEKTELSFVPEALTGTITSNHAFKIILYNTGTKNISDIIISTESDISLGTININSLKPNEQVQISLVTPENLTIGTDFIGTITATFSDQYEIFPFSFEVIEDEKKINIISDTIDVNLSCEDLNGKLCKDNEKCSVDTKSSTDGACCTGTCKKIKKSSTGMIIGILILIVLAGVVAIFYIKNRKRLKPKTTEEFLRGKNDKFSERMGGNEVHGGLGNA